MFEHAPRRELRAWSYKFPYSFHSVATASHSWGKWCDDTERFRSTLFYTYYILVSSDCLHDKPFISPSKKPNISDRKSTRLNSSHGYISYAVFCLKKKTTN